MFINYRTVIVYSFFLNFIISFYLNAQSQKIELTKDDIKFIIELENPEIHGRDDTLKINYTVINGSQLDVAIIDTKITGVNPPNPISFNKSLMVLQLDFGGLQILGEFDSIQKYRLLKKGKQFSTSLSFPISFIVHNINFNNIKEIQFFNKNQHIEVPIEAYISYSFDNEIINGEYSEILNFQNYIGYLRGVNTFDIIQYLQLLKISGISVKICSKGI